MKAPMVSLKTGISASTPNEGTIGIAQTGIPASTPNEGANGIAQNGYLREHAQ